MVGMITRSHILQENPYDSDNFIALLSVPFEFDEYWFKCLQLEHFLIY